MHVISYRFPAGLLCHSIWKLKEYRGGDRPSNLDCGVLDARAISASTFSETCLVSYRDLYAEQRTCNWATAAVELGGTARYYRESHIGGA